MEETKKREIRDWLAGPRVYEEGVQLYERYGNNLRMKKQFRFDPTATTRAMLVDELRRMAGLTEHELAALPRRSHTARQAPPAVGTPNQGGTQSIGSETPEQPGKPVQLGKIVTLRERFPFLNSPDCPDVLKILVNDMITAHNGYKSAHARLVAMDDAATDESAADCETVVESYLANREMWRELEYYRDHGALLGKAAIFSKMQQREDLSALSDVDLIGKLRSAMVNTSKHKKKAEAAAAAGTPDEKAEASYRSWLTRKQELQEELDRRKKK